MLSKKYRISSSFFLKKRRVVKKFSFDFLTVYVYDKEDNSKNDSFAVIVSKKISKKAVRRNYLRRIIYYSIRKAIKNMDRDKYYYIVFSLRKDDESIYEKIEKEVGEALNKI